MTKQEAIAAHRKMWRWIANETERRECAVTKDDYFDAMGISENERPRINSYCCEYRIQFKNNTCEDLCPIKWPCGNCIPISFISKFAQLSKDWQTYAVFARHIAELPEKEDVNYD